MWHIPNKSKAPLWGIWILFYRYSFGQLLRHRLSRDLPVVSCGENMWKLAPNPESLATSSHAPTGIRAWIVSSVGHFLVAIVRFFISKSFLFIPQHSDLINIDLLWSFNMYRLHSKRNASLLAYILYVFIKFVMNFLIVVFAFITYLSY